MTERKIIQIMPASGWGATFTEDDDELVTPLVGWALVQDAAGETSVIGLVAADGGVELADADSAFTGYVFLPDGVGEADELFEAGDFDEDDFDDDDFEDDDDDDDGAGRAGADGPAFDPKAGRLN